MFLEEFLAQLTLAIIISVTVIIKQMKISYAQTQFYMLMDQ